MTMAGAFAPPPPGVPPGRNAFEQTHATAEFKQLRKRRHSAPFTATALLLTAYLLNALVANEAREFMAIPVTGHFTVGLIASLALCAAAPLTAFWYHRYATNNLDPLSRRLSAGLERIGEGR